MNLSFAGCGFLGIYHIGVASCFREYAPHILVNKIAGASIGSLAACALICRIPLGQTTTDVLKVAVQARSRVLGPFHPGFDLNNIVREGLEKALPKDAHILCSGRLFISCTKFPNTQNSLLSQFDTREELIQALLCSCFIPLYSGLGFPKFRGMRYFDGGFSNNLPVLDENTITISPFTGETDICPQAESCNILQINLVNTSISICPENMYRFSSILYPPHPEVLNKMCQQGFDDALKYLQRNNLISCTRCMAVQSVLTLSETNAPHKANENDKAETEHAYDDCMDCRYRRQVALLDSLPEAVVSAIQEACDQVNKGIINWLFRHRPMKLLSVLGLPYVLPIDISILIFCNSTVGVCCTPIIVYIIVCRVWQALPKLQKEIRDKFDSIVNLIKSLLNKIDTNRHLYSAKFSCQLAITEFDYTEDNMSSSYSVPLTDIPQNTCKLITQPEGPPEKDKLFNFDVPDGKKSKPKNKRQSYAGFLSVKKEENTEAHRRKSMCDIRQPERVLRNMKFGFTMDLAPNLAMNKNRRQSVVDAFNALGEEEGELDVIDITNKALNWERECIGQYHSDLAPENVETIEKILDVTSNEAVMAYYYLDDNKTIKVTELFNMDDANTSAVLPDEEREPNNKLEWENEWLSNPNSSSYNIPSISVSDTLDDREFAMSDGEYEPKDDDTFDEFVTTQDTPSKVSPKVFQAPVPKRKKSFIIVN